MLRNKININTRSPIGFAGRLVTVITAVLVATLAVVATPSFSAEPEFTPSLSVDSTDAKAGAHPQTLKLAIDKPRTPEGDKNPMDELHLKRADITMDRGFMGNPSSTETCTSAEASSDSCPEGSLVGTMDVEIDAAIYKDFKKGPTRTYTVLEYPAKGKVYNATPTGSAPDGAAASLWMIIDANMQMIGWNGCYKYLGVRYCGNLDGNGDNTIKTRTYDIPNFPSDIPPGAELQEISNVLLLDIVASPVVVRADIGVTSDLRIDTLVPEMQEVTKVDYRLLQWVNKGKGESDPITMYKKGEPADYGADMWSRDADAYFDIRRMTMGLYGDRGADQNRHFLTNSTDCGPDVFDASFGSWPLTPLSTERFSGTKTYSSTSTLNITDCAALPFAPQSPIALSTYKTGDIPKIDIAIRQTYGEAHMKRVSMILPKFFVNIANLASCDDSLSLDQCPAGSNLGTVSAKTPISPDPFRGNLYLRSLHSDGTLGMTISLKGRVGNQDIPIELPLSAKIDAANGVVSVTSNELPQVPISELAISIDDKAGGSIFKNPNPGIYPYSVSFEGWNGASYTYSSSVNIGGTVLGGPDAELTVDLTDRNTRAHTGLDAEYELKDPERLKTFKLELGESKTKALRASTGWARRLSRMHRHKKRGLEIGSLLVGREKESRRARLIYRRGRVDAQISRGKARSCNRKIRNSKGNKRAYYKRSCSRYERDVEKLKVKIGPRYIQIGRLPNRYALKRVELSITDSGKLLRNPPRKGTVTFTASTDRRNTVTDDVEIKKRKRRSSRDRESWLPMPNSSSGKTQTASF